MRWLYKIPLRLRSVFRKNRVEQELSDELHFHLKELIEENLAKGITLDEAHYAALRELGGMEQIKEECRDMRRVNFIENLVQDVCFGLRMMTKNPGFTTAAVLALAMGIAANTAIFTAYDAMLRPIQGTDADRIVNIYRSTIEDHYSRGFNYADYSYYRERNSVFSDLIAASGTELAVSDAAGAGRPTSSSGGITGLLGIRFFQQMAGTAEFVRAAVVSENYFAGLEISPVMGRSFTAEESRGAYPVAMLSYNFWQRHFNSDSAVLGKTLRLNGKPFALIGITPKDFMGTYDNVPSVWLAIGAFPLIEPGRDPFHNRDDECCGLFGRLKPGVTIEQAESEMTVLAEQLRHTYPADSKNSRPLTITLTPGSPFGRASLEVLTVVLLVMGAVGLVLLIACANVAGLQLARAAARQKEIGVRLALGASRGRLVRQLLTEAALLGVLAGGAGLLFSWWALRFLVAAVSDSLPAEWGTLAFQVDPDVRVFAYTLIVSLFAGILFGLAPALETSNPNLTGVLKDEGATFGRRVGKSRLRDLMVGTQVAVCLVLLIAAGLLVRGSARAVRVDPGFETKKVLAMGIEMPPGLGYNAAKSGTIVREIVVRISRVPGVKSVARGRAPLAGGMRSASVLLDRAQEKSKGHAPTFNYSYVSPNFFESLSIPIIEGRKFTDEEARAGENVTIISQATGGKLWPGQDPIGKRVTLDARNEYHDKPFPAGQSFEVIGVTPDLRGVWLNELDPGYFYIPMPPDQFYESVLVRAENDPNALMTTLGNEVKAVDPNVIVYAETLDGLVTNNPGFVFSRVGAVLSSIVGLLGLLLASVGIYGTVGYAVFQRTHEVGIRMALGARRADVLRLILRETMKPVAVGMILGLAVSTATSRLLSRLLFGVSVLDPLAFVGVSLFLASVALAASIIPARRATRVDPVVALRYE